MQPLLQKTLASQIGMRSYRMVYFPRPGFVAEGITLRRNGAADLPPVGTASRLMIEGSYLDLLLLQNRVRHFDVDDLHIAIPAPGSEANKKDFPPGSTADFAGPQTAIESLHLRNAVLDLFSRGGMRLRYCIHDLRLDGVRRGRTVTFNVSMSNAVPAGEIQASGTFGPLLPNRLGQTQAAGHFTFARGDFSGIGKLQGSLTADGQFKGELSHIQVNGRSQTSGFRIGDGHPTDITSQYATVVDATNGDVIIQNVTLLTDKTTLTARGAITGSPKTTNLDLDVVSGRVEDLMRPFVQGQIPMSGPIHLRSHALLLPTPGDFLSRLRMSGDFMIPAGRFNSGNTEQSLSNFSARAEGQKPKKDEKADPPAADEVSSRMNATVIVASGFADFKSVTYQVPGALLNLHGRYGLRDQRAAMSGDLRMEKDLSHVTTGWKSWMLKPLAPFFRKRSGTGTDLPVVLVGRGRNYSIRSNVMDPK